jgi:2-polyprenyl-3-methyl-5-hydroxy-6-metoxy-1,4-benzoquinol methylase
MEKEFREEFARFSETHRKGRSPAQIALHERFALTNRERAREFVAYLRSALQYNLVGKRVLDVGSAYAGFAIACAAEGANAVGVEIDLELHRLGVINAQGEPGHITLVQGDILDPSVLREIQSPPFDLVILNDVFEHVYDSVSLFERLANVTGRQSIVYFSIPNGDCYDAIKSEGHYARPGLSLLEPSDWSNLVGRFNVYYRRFRYYQALFHAYGFPNLYLRVDIAALRDADRIVPNEFAAFERLLSAEMFSGNEDLSRRARKRLKILMDDIERRLALQDPLMLLINYGQHFWSGFATKVPQAALDSNRSIAKVELADSSGSSAMGTLDARGFVQDYLIDLSGAVVETQDNKPALARTPSGDERRRVGLALTNRNDPRKDDFTRWRLNLPAEASRYYLVCVVLKNDFENPRLAGRVAWSLWINGTKLHTEDIALSSERRHLTAAISQVERIEIQLELRALRDCEPWHWGTASTTFIDGITIQSSSTAIIGDKCRPITGTAFPGAKGVSPVGSN